jgi:hypothetical protein
MIERRPVILPKQHKFEIGQPACHLASVTGALVSGVFHKGNEYQWCEDERRSLPEM